MTVVVPDGWRHPPCERCGAEWRDGEFWTNWLCPRCHMEMHSSSRVGRFIRTYARAKGTTT